MKELLFKGSACAIVTPFSEEKDVDLSKLEELCRFQISNGTQAIVVCGTTGEATTLTYEERSACVQCAVKTVDKKIPVIAGTGSNNTETAVRLSNEAEKEGVDGLLIVTPFYNKTSQEGIVAHYEYIAERVSKPIIVYNVPSRTGLDIKPETYHELSKIKNIVAIKEANGNLSAAAKTFTLCGDTLAVYSGNDDQTIPFISLGGCGVISVIANIMPRAIQNLAKLCFEGEYRRAAMLQRDLTEIEDALFADVNPIPVKAIMEQLGMCSSTVRLPLIGCRQTLKERLMHITETLPNYHQ